MVCILTIVDLRNLDFYFVFIQNFCDLVAAFFPYYGYFMQKYVHTINLCRFTSYYGEFMTKREYDSFMTQIPSWLSCEKAQEMIPKYEEFNARYRYFIIQLCLGLPSQ